MNETDFNKVLENINETGLKFNPFFQMRFAVGNDDVYHDYTCDEVQEGYLFGTELFSKLSTKNIIFCEKCISEKSIENVTTGEEFSLINISDQFNALVRNKTDSYDFDNMTFEDTIKVLVSLENVIEAFENPFFIVSSMESFLNVNESTLVVLENILYSSAVTTHNVETFLKENIKVSTFVEKLPENHQLIVHTSIVYSAHKRKSIKHYVKNNVNASVVKNLCEAYVVHLPALYDKWCVVPEDMISVLRSVGTLPDYTIKVKGSRTQLVSVSVKVDAVMFEEAVKLAPEVGFGFSTEKTYNPVENKRVFEITRNDIENACDILMIV